MDQEIDVPQLAADSIVRVTGGAVGAAARTRRSAAHVGLSIVAVGRPRDGRAGCLTISMYPQWSTRSAHGSRSAFFLPLVLTLGACASSRRRAARKRPRRALRRSCAFSVVQPTTIFQTGRRHRLGARSRAGTSGCSWTATSSATFNHLHAREAAHRQRARRRSPWQSITGAERTSTLTIAGVLDHHHPARGGRHAAGDAGRADAAIAERRSGRRAAPDARGQQCRGHWQRRERSRPIRSVQRQHRSRTTRRRRSHRMASRKAAARPAGRFRDDLTQGVLYSGARARPAAR